jgi:nucleotide-binding universal stress UspA family protein
MIGGTSGARVATMAAFKTILLCYDSTREGRRALLQGAELAQQLGAETHLLAIAPTIVGSSMMDMPSAVALQEAERNIRDVLREGVERLRARGLVATGHLAFGRPTEQIPAVARDLGVDLIIIGHRPCGVVERWWAGPGNAQLLDHIACSILVSIDPNETTAP